MPSAKHLWQAPSSRLQLRTSQMRGFFNLNWRPWLRVLSMVFFTITWKATYMIKSIVRNIVLCYLNKNPLQTFCRDYFWTSGKCLRWSHFLIKTQDYSLLVRTLLNSVTDDFMRLLWNSCTEKNIYIENIFILCCGVPYKCKCRNTVYSLLPN